MNTEIPKQITPFEVEAKSLEDAISSLAASMISASSDLGQQINEHQIFLDQLQSTFNEYSESTQKVVHEYSSCLSILQNQLEAIHSKAVQIEATHKVSSESLKSFSEFINNFNSDVQSFIEQSQLQLSTQISTFSSQVDGSLKVEQKILDESTILSNLNEVKDKTHTEFQRIQKNITNLPISFEQSLLAISNPLKKVLTNKLKESEKHYQYLSNLLNKAVEQTEKDFPANQVETYASIDTISIYSKQVMDELEKKLVTEIKKRQSSEKKLVGKCNVFKTFFVGEMKAQRDQIMKFGLETTNTVVLEFNSLLLPSRQSVAEFQFKSQNVGKLLEFAKQLETSSEDLSKSSHNDINLMGRQCRELSSSINIMDRDCESAISSSLERLQMIGCFDDGKEFLLKEEAESECARINNQIDQKIVLLQEKIKKVSGLIHDKLSGPNFSNY